MYTLALLGSQVDVCGNSAFLRLRVTETMSEKERRNFIWRLKGRADPPRILAWQGRLFWCQIRFQHPKLP